MPGVPPVSCAYLRLLHSYARELSLTRVPGILQRDYKDSELYILRYQQCLSRSMTFIKIHFVGTIKSLGADVGKRLMEQVRFLTTLLFGSTELTMSLFP